MKNRENPTGGGIEWAPYAPYDEAVAADTSAEVGPESLDTENIRLSAAKFIEQKKEELKSYSGSDYNTKEYTKLGAILGGANGVGGALAMIAAEFDKVTSFKDIPLSDIHMIEAFPIAAFLGVTLAGYVGGYVTDKIQNFMEKRKIQKEIDERKLGLEQA